MTTPTKEQIQGFIMLRDEVLYHQRRAKEMNDALTTRLAAVGLKEMPDLTIVTSNDGEGKIAKEKKDG
jgi:hypothetical protein